MKNTILGLHHITAIAGDAQQNYDFYTGTLGLRMVKKTVNFDDPHTYHLYFGDEVGSPGTILTFFPWAGARPGKDGAGMATEIGYSVPKGSLEFWKDRFEEKNVRHFQIAEKFGERKLNFQDPDGLKLSLIETTGDTRKAYETKDVQANVAIKGFHTVTLTLLDIEPTAALLTGVLGYEKIKTDGNLTRYATKAVENAAFVDLLEAPGAARGINSAGTNHHVAFRVQDEESLMEIRKKVLQYGLQITEKIDRNYFYSLYFREPGGVLFEIATDNPGFAIDESVENLGTSLVLPPRYENAREQIEKALPVLKN
ncbi:MAG: ring-cleaving dioxygenase [Gillisia sp.]